MVSSNRLLQKCEQLASRFAPLEFIPGMIVARGFADLGYEEFALVREDILVSLYTGKVSELPVSERKRFFCVPTCDQLVEMIIKAEFEIVSLDFFDQRVWNLVCEDLNSKERREFSAPDLQEVFINCLLSLLPA